MSIETAIRIISEEIALREEFERRRAIRMGLDPKKVLSDREESIRRDELRGVGSGSS